MNTEPVIIDDDNDSIETVVIVDEDTVTNSQNKPNLIEIEVDSVDLHEEISRPNGTSQVMEIDEILDINKSEDSFANVLRDTVEILDEDTVANSGDTINLDEDILKSEASNISEELFANLLRNNRLMSKLLRKCLNMQDSDGMTRVIHKTVLPMYKDTDTSFKASAHLRRVIKTTLKQLELDPRHKFSHIKSLCNTLHSKKYRKKVAFTTLSTDLTNRTEQGQSENNNTSTMNESNDTKTNDTQTDVIDLINSDKDIINLDSNEEEYSITNLDETTRSHNSNKENNILTNDIDLGVTYIEIDKEATNTSKHPENFFLLPQTHKDYTVESDIFRKVQMLEDQIAIYKSRIEKLEKLEVNDFSLSSPYILCDRMKAKVVSIYEEICTLTGGEPVKRREVRLRVTEGHPPGPVGRLEEFLNSNIDSRGNPIFPDFLDVLDCVQKASDEDCLSWTKEGIIKEARSLFTQCAHALRTRRQKREWRDLMSLVKEEQPDEDPADEDPELLARLEENNRLAQEKEHQILERFAQMEHKPRVVSPLNPRLGNMDIIQDTFDGSSASETEDNVINSRDRADNCESNTNIADTVNVNLNREENMPSNTNVAEAANVGSELPLLPVVKQEPPDIQSMLDGLGSDYTVTVCDIEDPFLVIEISSDSSYSDDDNS